MSGIFVNIMKVRGILVMVHFLKISYSYLVLIWPFFSITSCIIDLNSLYYSLFK